ncbi:MAG: DUF1016 family protein [Filimonas sp.]|nr:DUF1016 family protein [Filimonas sp.]
MKNTTSNKNVDFDSILILIQEARARVYAKANAELVLLYFNVGKIVSEKVSAGKWGENTVQELADFINAKQPGLSGFNRRGLYRMRQFYESYNEHSACFSIWCSINEKSSTTNTQQETTTQRKSEIVTTLPTQFQLSDNELLVFVTTLLSQIQWSAHLHILNKAKSAEEKLFYIQLAVKEKLSVREIERQLNTCIFERSMLGRSKVLDIIQPIQQNFFKDPYIFEFLNLPEGHIEKDFESAIIQNLQKFILEIGKGFAYMGNQYRLQVGNKDYYTDLLFYHRELQCLVLFELKIQEFEPEFLGKLNFYLEALDRDIKRPNENPSIGILLCKGKDTEVVEYAMARNASPAIIAEYETKLIDKKLLADKLHQLAEVLKRER